MFCKNCGKEVQDDWKTCPFCGSGIERKASAETEKAEERTETTKVYELRGIRRGGNFIQREIQTRVEIDGGEVSVCTGRKSKDKKFKITDIAKVQCSYGPVWWVSDFVRIAIFALLMLLSYGMAAFAVILSLYIACSNQLILVLKDGTKVRIPVCQKGEAVELLEGLGAYEEANKYKGKLVSETSWNVKYFLISIALYALAVSTLYLGMNMMMDKVKEMEAKQNRHEQEDMREDIDEDEEAEEIEDTELEEEEEVQSEGITGVYEDSEDGMQLYMYQEDNRVSFICFNADDTLFAQAYNCRIEENDFNGTYINGVYWFVGQNPDGTFNMSSGAGGAWGHFAKIEELDELDEQMMEETAKAYAYVEGKTFHKINNEMQVYFETSINLNAFAGDWQDYYEYLFFPEYNDVDNTISTMLYIGDEECGFFYTENGFYISGSGNWSGDYEFVEN